MKYKVSVIMAVYNGEPYLKDSIESIIHQSFTDWQFVICDDGSSDNSFSILCEYKEKYPEKIIVLQNSVNSKLPFSLNHCLKYASGEYIARMDADDIAHPERLKKQVEYLDYHPDISVVGTGMICFDNDINNITGIRYPMAEPNSKIIGNGVPFYHATIMMRKEVYDKLGGYSLKPHVLRCEDVDLWIRFFGNGYYGANIQDPLYYVREDFAAAQRRNFRNSINTSKTLFWGFRAYNYPIWQYALIAKPLISALIPRKMKYFINSIRWRKNK